MEYVMYYAVALMFGAVAILFFYTGFNGSGTVDSKPLYYGIGAVFGLLSFAMFVKNGALIESLLGLIVGVPCVWFGIMHIIDVFQHNIRVEAILKKITYHRGGRGGGSYRLDFEVPQYRTKYTVDSVSSKRKFIEGESYVIYISKKDAKAHVHRIRNVLLGLIMVLTGLMFLSIIGMVLKIF